MELPEPVTEGTGFPALVALKGVLLQREELGQEDHSQELQWRWTVAQKSGRVSHLFDFFSEIFCCFWFEEENSLSNLILFGKYQNKWCKPSVKW